ncbi:MAG: toll/interleukin-1 receptor domain-containing protein [Fibrobacter sp.]|jgi:hypothetical protein|nr:toll/interleukin-1 receptor domain-containing protein [Fibrobacter sp.]
MILSKDMLESFSSQIERLTLDEAEGQRCFSSYQIVSTVFLSHKHEDVLQLKQARRILSSLNAHVYIDWLDKSMPKETSGETAIKLRKKIKESDRFILLATDGAIQSKWCNWELGQGDALKYEQEKIALFPLRENGKNWSGSEYMEIYPVIEYEDGNSVDLAGKKISAGYYVFSPAKDNCRHYESLSSWLIK